MGTCYGYHIWGIRSHCSLITHSINCRLISLTSVGEINRFHTHRRILLETNVATSEVILIFICIYPLMFGSFAASMYLYSLSKIANTQGVSFTELNNFIEKFIPNAAIRLLLISLSAIEISKYKNQKPIGCFTLFRIFISFLASVVFLMSLFIPEINNRDRNVVMLGASFFILTILIILILVINLVRFYKSYSGSNM
jgi:hypothetical protein